MTQANAPDLLAEYERIVERMATRLSAPEREEIRAAIIGLFHDTDAALLELSQFKESIRDLIARFKALPPAAALATDSSTRISGRGQDASVRHDHVGASTYIERGWSALSAGHWPEAENHLRRAIALDGTSISAKALLGWALMFRGREDEAMELCRETLAQVPDHGLSHVVVGAILLRKGNPAEAVEHLAGVATHSSDARAVLYANYWLGVAYLDREMIHEAEEALRRALRLGPNLAEGWLELGHALWRKNRMGEARQAWESGAAIRHSPHALICRQQLDAIAHGGRPVRSPLR